MNRNLFVLLTAFSIFIIPLGCKATNRRSEPHELEINTHRTQNQTTNTNIDKSIPIKLSIGSFDPVSDKSPAADSHELIIQNYEDNENGYYILQFKGPVLEQWKVEAIAAGAILFDYIPQFAFLARMNSQARKRVREMSSVRWIGIYQPAYRIAPDLTVTLSEKVNRPVDVIISVFRGENTDAISAKIERLKGKILQISSSKEKLILKIPVNRIASLSRLTGIKYIEKVPEFKINPGIKKKGGHE